MEIQRQQGKKKIRKCEEFKPLVHTNTRNIKQPNT